MSGAKCMSIRGSARVRRHRYHRPSPQQCQQQHSARRPGLPHQGRRCAAGDALGQTPQRDRIDACHRHRVDVSILRHTKQKYNHRSQPFAHIEHPLFYCAFGQGVQCNCRDESREQRGRHVPAGARKRGHENIPCWLATRPIRDRWPLVERSRRPPPPARAAPQARAGRAPLLPARGQ